MIIEANEFRLLVPELFVLTMACVVLIVDLFLKQQQRMITYYLSQATLLGAILLTTVLQVDGIETGFSGTFVSDPMSVVLKLAIYLVTLLGFLYSQHPV